ncbi:TetR/AcrR family transcriptional regulator [Anaerorhabdus sp.]|uniref:TetR/AcrR family transcriptional regulator n=1 Tax=Anaerorhabdus sp. TaxID=1872524 RepID=UPI002FC96218
MSTTEKEIKIYTAVFQLAKEGKDLNSLRVQDIADAADMGKGTLYEYFGSKDEIIEKTIEYFFSIEVDLIKKMIAVDEPFEEKLRKFMLSFVHRTQKYSSMEVLVTHTEKISASCLLEKNKERMATLVPVIAEILDQIIQVGINQKIYNENEDREYLSFSLMSALAGFVMCIKVSDDPLHDPNVAKAMNSAMRLILNKE